MNAIADKLGKVGLPAPVSELAARTWDAIIVGDGHGLTCAAYLARAGKRVLVLEARERLGGACTLDARSRTSVRSSAPAPMSSAYWTTTSSRTCS